LNLSATRIALILNQEGLKPPKGLWHRTSVLRLPQFSNYRPHRTTTESRVYFVQEVNTKALKIGHASNVGARVRGMQTGCPSAIRILATVPGGREVEKIWHARFAHLRLHHEWFHAGEDLLLAMKSDPGVTLHPQPTKPFSEAVGRIGELLQESPTKGKGVRISEGKRIAQTIEREGFEGPPPLGLWTAWCVGDVIRAHGLGPPTTSKKRFPKIKSSPEETSGLLLKWFRIVAPMGQKHSGKDSPIVVSLGEHLSKNPTEAAAFSSLFRRKVATTGYKNAREFLKEIGLHTDGCVRRIGRGRKIWVWWIDSGSWPPTHPLLPLESLTC